MAFDLKHAPKYTGSRGRQTRVYSNFKIVDAGFVLIVEVKKSLASLRCKGTGSSIVIENCIGRQYNK